MEEVYNHRGAFCSNFKVPRHSNMFDCIALPDSFTAQIDKYMGITVETEDLTMNDEEFEQTLSEFVEMTAKHTRVLWFKVDIEHSSYIPVLVKHGFNFHHAKPSYAMLTKWVKENEPNNLPNFPHTHIGVGGLVIKDEREVLTIQEKYHKAPFWKLPGGYSNPGEDFAETARREVFEETGIDTEFQSIVAFRHKHHMMFDNSDIYLVCHLKPKSTVIRRDSNEISACQWMDIETFTHHPEVSEFNKFIMISFMKNRHYRFAIEPTLIRAADSDELHKVYTAKNKSD